MKPHVLFVFSDDIASTNTVGKTMLLVSKNNTMNKMKARILIIEDDLVVNELVTESLSSANYQLVSCHDGNCGLTKATEQDFDLILLDVMLPGLNGLEVLTALRKIKTTPVLMLTALGNEEQRIAGLRTGADDYLCKPFNIEELRLRIEAILRRFHVQGQQLPSSPTSLTRFAQAIPELTSLELDIIEQLAQRVAKPVSKLELYQSALNKEFGRYDRTLDMHISNIRKKLGRVEIEPNLIKTVHGKGYMLTKALNQVSLNNQQ